MRSGTHWTPAVASTDPALDVHQHLWPEPFLAALRARREPPRLDGWTLHLPGEPPVDLDPADHDPVLRAKWLTERVGGSRAQPLLARSAWRTCLAQRASRCWTPTTRASRPWRTWPVPIHCLGWWAALPRETALTDSVRAASCARCSNAAQRGCRCPRTWLSRPEDFAALQPVLAVAAGGRPAAVHPPRRRTSQPGRVQGRVVAAAAAARLVGARWSTTPPRWPPPGGRGTRSHAPAAAHVARLLRRRSRTRPGAPGAAAGSRWSTCGPLIRCTFVDALRLRPAGLRRPAPRAGHRRARSRRATTPTPWPSRSRPTPRLTARFATPTRTDSCPEACHEPA